MIDNKIAAMIGLGLLGLFGWKLYERIDIRRSLERSAVTQATEEIIDVVNRLPDPGRSQRDSTDIDANAEPLDIFAGLIRAGQDLSRIGNEFLHDIAGITPTEEVEIGEQAHEMIVSQQTVLRSGRSVDRLWQVAEPFLEHRDRKDLDVHFYVIEDESVNAFAHLGGHIYVHTGLLDAIQSDDELAFVLGHEVAHVDLGHCAKSMTAVVRAEQIGGQAVGSLAAIAYRAIALGYSESQEFEADRWSYGRLRELGYTHDRSLAGLRMLERECAEEGHVHSGPLGEIDEHLRSHPRVSDRIEALKRQQL